MSVKIAKISVTSLDDQVSLAKSSTQRRAAEESVIVVRAFSLKIRISKFSRIFLLSGRLINFWSWWFSCPPKFCAIFKDNKIIYLKNKILLCKSRWWDRGLWLTGFNCRGPPAAAS